MDSFIVSAIACLKRSALSAAHSNVSPQGQRYRAFLSFALTGQRQFAEAEKVARSEPDELSRDFALGVCAHARNDDATARDCLARIEARRSTMGVLGDYNAYVATLKGALGDLDGGLAELEQSIAARDPGVCWLGANYHFVPPARPPALD